MIPVLIVRSFQRNVHLNGVYECVEHFVCNRIESKKKKRRVWVNKKKKKRETKTWNTNRPSRSETKPNEINHKSSIGWDACWHEFFVFHFASSTTIKHELLLKCMRCITNFLNIVYFFRSFTLACIYLNQNENNHENEKRMKQTAKTQTHDGRKRMHGPVSCVPCLIHPEDVIKMIKTFLASASH